MHWTAAAHELQASLPQGLYIDTFQGKAYVGMVAFVMSRICLSGASTFATRPFLEFNLRTYVYDEMQRPGVWFYSLNANHRLGVAVARLMFHLNYQHASIAYASTGRHVSYRAERKGAAFGISANVLKEKSEALPLSLEEFLFERYLYFTQGKALWSGRIFHAPYQLQSCEEINYNAGLFSLDGLSTPGDGPCHAAYADRLQIEAFWPQKVMQQRPC